MLNINRSLPFTDQRQIVPRSIIPAFRHGALGPSQDDQRFADTNRLGSSPYTDLHINYPKRIRRPQDTLNTRHAVYIPVELMPVASLQIRLLANQPSIPQSVRSEHEAARAVVSILLMIRSYIQTSFRIPSTQSSFPRTTWHRHHPPTTATTLHYPATIRISRASPKRSIASRPTVPSRASTPSILTTAIPKRRALTCRTALRATSAVGRNLRWCRRRSS